MSPVLQRGLKFLVAGGLTTGVSYVCFILLLRVMHYAPATVLAWAAGLGIGFALNRRHTFGISGPERRGRHFALYVVGALLQLALGLAGYAILMGRMGMDPTPAFILNTGINASFGFAFQNLVTFRKALARRNAGA